METLKKPTMDRGQLDRLPIFPLPGLVFFPNTLLPLHIFEPRYREMVAWCIEEGWPMAMAMVAPGEEVDGRVGVQPVLSLGELVYHKTLSDGRYHIVLKGLGRLRMREELEEGTPYRLVSAEWMQDEVEDDAALRGALTSIKGCLVSLGQRLPKLSEPLLRVTTYTDEPAVLVDVWSAALLQDEGERRAVLMEATVEGRAQVVLEKLTELLMEGMGGEFH